MLLLPKHLPCTQHSEHAVFLRVILRQKFNLTMDVLIYYFQ